MSQIIIYIIISYTLFSYIIVLVIKLQICTSNCYKLYLLERFNINNKTLNFIEDCLKLIETNTNRVFEYIANNPGCIILLGAEKLRNNNNCLK